MHTVEEIAALLHIHKEAAAHGGSMNNIAGAALARLRQINEDMKPDAFTEDRSASEGHDQKDVTEPAAGTIPRRELGSTEHQEEADVA